MVIRHGVLRTLPRREKRLVFKAVWLVLSIRFSAWLNPAQAVETYHRVFVQRSSTHYAPIYQLIWAIQTATRLLPKTSSLVEALATKVLLARYGYDSKLHVGVAKKAERYEGHAWLTQGQDVIVGELSELTIYRPVSSVKGRKAKLDWRPVRA
ncbi:MAG: lasso peptide biosynthesis B2 protein [Trueperaceae bacterium]